MLKPFNMLKPFVGTLMIVAAAQTVEAQVTVDISKITCEQFNVLLKQDTVAVWLGGYYHGQHADMVVDMNKFDETVRNVRAACLRPDNFKRPVIQLIESSIPK